VFLITKEMLSRKFSGMETFLFKEEGNKKPHSLGSGVKSYNPSPLEARRD